MNVLSWWRVAGLAAFACMFLVGPADAQFPESEESTPPADERIQKLEAQIAELAAQLEAIKQEQAAPTESEGDSTTVVLGTEALEALQYRELGPATMGGRITDIAIYEADPCIFYVATASGGLLKTTNNGVGFTHQFDFETTVSIGAVAVAATDPDLVWIGTGEENPRNSVSYGDGVYKSTDGGETWTNMGLAESFQIGDIIIDPNDPNIVYVAALGRLYGPNEERGLFKTVDGGETWTKVLYVDEKTGVLDIEMHPSDPSILLAATYERKRDGFDTNDPAVKIAPGSGLYRSTDAGATWTEITDGLPTCDLGRIGLDWHVADPNIVFMILESEMIGSGDPNAPKPAYMGVTGGGEGAALTRVVEDGPAAKAGLQEGDVVTAVGDVAIDSYQGLVQQIRDAGAGETVTIKFRRGTEEKTAELTWGERPSQGGSSSRPFGSYLGGQRENVQDKQGEDGFEYGGVYRSDDAGISWTRVNSLNPRPMYFSQVRVDPSDPNYVYVLGISFYRSKDGGKTFTGDAGRGVHADNHALWIDPNDGRHLILGCDGGVYVSYDRTSNWDHLNTYAIGQFYHVTTDSTLDYKVYGGLQDNGSWGGPAFLRSGGIVNQDWFRVGGGDGFRCFVDPEDPDLVYYTSQNGGMARRNFRTGEGARIRPDVERGTRVNFNWNTPFLLSSHNPKIFYAAGNYVFRSLDRGNDLVPISESITLTERGSATALSESPLDPDVIYVGTDDGAFWMTRDGGQNWTDIRENVGLEGPRWVSTLEASRYEDGRVYACFDGHRSDDDRPLLFVSEDYGQTWASLSANLPRGSTRCLREDRTNPDLLWCGTEFGLYASLDRGQYWNRINGEDLPTVAIHEIAQHPKLNDIVLATHGRSIWVLDSTPLRGMTAEILAAEEATILPTGPAIRWRRMPSRGGTNREFVGDNRPQAALIYYMLPEDVEELRLTVRNVAGETVRRLRTSDDAGLHRAIWDLNLLPPGGDNQGNSRSRRRGRPAPVGEYLIVLEIDGEQVATQTLRVLGDPAYPESDLITESFELLEENDEEIEID